MNVIEDSESNKVYELKMAKIHWDDHESLLLLFSDITKTKKLIELQNKDNYKNQLLATISHDLRTPLNGVIGMISATISEIVDSKHKEFLNIALKSAHLLEFLIKDILDFSQFTFKKLRMNFSSFNIMELVEEVMSLMQFQAKNRDISLELITKIKENSLICRSDPNRIKQILINLIGNAIKFTKTGFVRLTLELEHPEDNNYLLKFSVQDTGIGIKQEDQRHLFKLFGKLKQEDPEINKNGIGLGLAISNALVRLLYDNENENFIHLQSKYGEGSLFWFYVDIGEALITEKQQQPSPSKFSPSLKKTLDSDSPKNQEKGNKAILLVDDDALNLFVLENYLEKAPFKLIKAQNGAEAVKIVENEVLKGEMHISLILMDCNMPVMNGFIATDKIIESLKRANREIIPIIGITANDIEYEEEKGLAAGMKKMLMKPVKKEEFMNVIQNYL